MQCLAYSTSSNKCLYHFFTRPILSVVSNLWELSLERNIELNCRGALLLALYSANNLWSLKILELGSDMFIAVISLYKQSSPVGWNFFSLLHQLSQRLNFLFFFFKEIKFSMQVANLPNILLLKKWNIPQWLEGLSSIFEIPSLSCLVPLFTVIHTAEPKVLFLTVVHYFTLRNIGTPFTIGCTPQSAAQFYFFPFLTIKYQLKTLKEVTNFYRSYQLALIFYC